MEHAPVSDLSRIVKAYDVRGTVPDQLNEPVAEALGTAFVRGARAAGAGSVDAGRGSTDLLYFASGALDLPGAMFTASHNPAKYNGIKLCRAGAAPVGQETGLREIRQLIEAGVPSYDGKSGTVSGRDLLADYAEYL